nr:retrovirus-related Pol polyprotein from transposon TNT 1-94 [Tanacetum cinerariifolium]
KFSKGIVDPTLFIKREGKGILLVQIYVDDIIFSSTDPNLCESFSDVMCSKFKMSVMGMLSFSLGLQISQSPRGIFLNQSKYALESLKKYGACVSTSTCGGSGEDGIGGGNGTYNGGEGIWGNGDDIRVSGDGGDVDHAGCQDTRRSTSGSMKLLGERLLADIFTKALPRERLNFLIEKIGIKIMSPETLISLAAEDAKRVDTPMVEKSKLDEDPNGKAIDSTRYRGMIGTLMNSTCLKAFTISTDVPEILMQQFWYTIQKVKDSESYEFLLANKRCVVDAKVFRKVLDIYPRNKGKEFTEVQNDEDTITFFLDLRYKDIAYQINHRKEKKSRCENMPYPRFTKVIIDCFLSKHKSLKKLKFQRYHMIKDDDTNLIKVSSYNILVQFLLKIVEAKVLKGRRLEILLKKIGKGSQGKKTRDTAKENVDVSEESDPKPLVRKKTSKRRVAKKKATISAADNIVRDPDLALELGKSISLTEAEEEAVARQVYAIHDRIVSQKLKGEKEEMTDAAKVDTEKTMSSDYGDQFLDLSHSDNLSGVVKDSSEAETALDEYDKKSALVWTMHENKTYNRNVANYKLYHALMEALLDDEEAMDKEVDDTMKDHKRKHGDDDDEGPSAGPNQGPTFNLLKGMCSNSIKLEYNFQECFNALTNKLYWNNLEEDHYHYDLTKPLPLQGESPNLIVAADYFFNNDSEYLKSSDPTKNYATSITKTKAARLFHLNKKDIVDFIMVVRMFTRSLIIKRRVEDLQLGVESYQKKLNITAPQKTFLGIEFKELYTPSGDLTRIVYKDLDKQPRLIQANELYKFSDGTLQAVRDELHHRIHDFNLGFNKEMPLRKWSKVDVRRSKLMVKLIDKQLLERRIIRNLEQLVGARELEMDYRLMQRIV